MGLKVGYVPFVNYLQNRVTFLDTDATAHLFSLVPTVLLSPKCWGYRHTDRTTVWAVGRVGEQAHGRAC